MTLEMHKGMAWDGPFAVALLPQEELTLRHLLKEGGEVSVAELDRLWGRGNGKRVAERLARTLDVLGWDLDVTTYGAKLGRRG